MEQENWLSEKYSRIEELSKDFSISKYNLLKISYLKRILEKSIRHSKECDDCKNNLTVLESLIEEIPNLDLIDHRSPYEKKFNGIRKHFHKNHNFIPPYYHSARWSIFGILAGLLVSIILSYSLFQQLQLDPLLAGMTIGLILGYIIGSTKEISYRKTKKII